MNTQLNEEEKFKLLEDLMRFRTYATNELKIQNKVGEIVPFVVNSEQSKILDVIDQLKREGKPIRLVVLKSRQEGVSTLAEGLIFHDSAIKELRNSLIVSHDPEGTDNLFRMCKRFYENLRPEVRPMKRYSNKTELVFDNPDEVQRLNGNKGLESRITIATANKTEARGSTIHNLHGCLHENSLVVLADGSSKKIKDICIGDKVFTASGAVAPVKAKIKSGIKQTYKLNTWMTNEPIIASLDHKILTLNGYKPLSALTNNDWIAKPKYKFDRKDTWTFCLENKMRKQGGGSVHEVERMFNLSEDFGYLVGYYLAEGHISKNLGRVTFAYEVTEKFINKVEHFFPNPARKITIGNKGITEFNSVFMAHALNELCGRTKEKHVPLFGNEKFFNGILCGYLDGDGSKTDATRVRAVSVHEKIARNINRIGDLLGKHASMCYRANRKRYNVNTLNIWENMFCYGEKKPWIKKYKFKEKQCFIRVKTIQKFEMAETYDLEIDHPDHNFETPSGVVSNSEIAFWRDAETLMLAAMQMIPDHPDTMVILESTANGIGGYFYDTWVNAINGRNSFVPIFLAWYDFPEYSKPIAGQFILTEEEQELKDKYKITNESLNWRRFAIADKCGGDINKFHQEYPSTWEEAFIASGTPKFNQEILRQYYSLRRQPVFTGEIDGDWRSPQLIQNSQGRFKIYKMPNPKHKYVISGDVAKGTPTSDFSCAQIYDCTVGDFVATWHGKEDPTVFATTLAQLGVFYRGAESYALVGCEVNKDGITTNRALYYDIGYKKLFRRRSIIAKGDDQTENLGFHTNETSRPVIINLLADFILQAEGELNNETTLLECMTFVIDESGKPTAQEGCHDDSVISAGIALYLAGYVPEEKTQQSWEQIRKQEVERRGSEEQQFFKKKQQKPTSTMNW